MNASFEFLPVLSGHYLWLLAFAAAVVLMVAVLRRAPDFRWRAGFLLAVALLLLNPYVYHEDRQSLNDKLIVVVDESLSLKTGGRDVLAGQALAQIEKTLEGMPGVDAVVVRSGADPTGANGTELFKALRDSLMSLPAAQVAGTVLITDGQVHDVPDELGPLSRLAPFHVVLTGSRSEFDRKVTVVNAPRYGVIDEDISITLRVDAYGADAGAQPLPLSVSQDGEAQGDIMVTPGQPQDFTFRLRHAGQNVFEFSIPPDTRELTAANNTAAVIVNGIRDRLRVLLVSDAPHMGGRAWRNLLKSDPSIDLVHFTLLRSPMAVDPAPSHELSLIAFPVDELFERKIRDFDLIIFDRYQQYGLLLPHYFENIASYIRDGGAFLMAMGTEEPQMALFTGPVGTLLPVRPTPGRDAIVRQNFTPAVTQAGITHPVTADLKKPEGAQGWGEWRGLVNVAGNKGDVLMTGPANRPLLVLDSAGKGRVAVLASDHVWLWSKGGRHAGPYNELLRNVAHWLMKEPELEADYIKAEARGNRITVAVRDIGADDKSLSVVSPSGTASTLTPSRREGGWIMADMTAEETGIYSFSRGTRKAFVVVGTVQSPEFFDVHTTPEKLKPVVEKSGGQIIWFGDDAKIDLRQVSASATRKGGEGWLGLRRNESYSVTNIASAALLPNPAVLLLLLAGAVFVWWIEGRKN